MGLTATIAEHAAVRTRTGLLESHLERAQEIERVATYRLASEDDPPSQDEREVAEQIRGLAVGLQRLFRRWIRLRADYERRLRSPHALTEE